MTIQHTMRRSAATLGVLGLAVGLGACDDMLTVSNPGAIGEGTVNDPAMKTELVNSVVGEFQRMYTDMANWGAILSDEAVTGHNFYQIQEFDLRVVEERNSLLDDVYEPVQRARGLGESLTEELREQLGAEATSDLGLARALAYTGYSSVVLGEMFCEAPVEPEAAALSSDEILERALPYFEDAIAYATAAKDAGADSAEADFVINLARVGGARAALQVGNTAKAIELASPVPPDFEAWVRHDGSKSYLENPFFDATDGTNHNIGLDEKFRDLNDPRIRYNPEGRTGHNQLTILFTPHQSSSYDEWTLNGADMPFTKDTDIRFASGLEARYIVAEAEGPTQATEDFVNERRTYVGQPTVDLSGDALMAELRDQRRRDFFMDGHRLGDIRRYLALYDIDEFPTGAHPNAAWGNYGSATCYIPHVDERLNPAY